jgi:hypothetical protein
MTVFSLFLQIGQQLAAVGVGREVGCPALTIEENKRREVVCQDRIFRFIAT